MGRIGLFRAGQQHGNASLQGVPWWKWLSGESFHNRLGPHLVLTAMDYKHLQEKVHSGKVSHVYLP